MSQRKNYSEEFKLSVIRDYYSSGMSKGACVRKYGLCHHVLLLKWLRKYESEKVSLPLQSESSNDDDMANRSKDDYKKEIAALKKRNRELEKALEFSRLISLFGRDFVPGRDRFFVLLRRKGLISPT